MILMVMMVVMMVMMVILMVMMVMPQVMGTAAADLQKKSELAIARGPNSE